MAFRLNLLGGFALDHADRRITVPMSTQRVLAFLALSRRPQLRVYVAGSLWTDSAQEVANARLRTALWRLGRDRRGLIESTSVHVGLRVDLEVDVLEATDRARGLLSGEAFTAEDL